jgi:hypothetical protein
MRLTKLIIFLLLALVIDSCQPAKKPEGRTIEQIISNTNYDMSQPEDKDFKSKIIPIDK